MQYNYSATILSCTIYSNGFTFDWILSIAPRANRYHRMIPVRATRARFFRIFRTLWRFRCLGAQVSPETNYVQLKHCLASGGVNREAGYNM